MFCAKGVERPQVVRGWIADELAGEREERRNETQARVDQHWDALSQRASENSSAAPPAMLDDWRRHD